MLVEIFNRDIKHFTQKVLRAVSITAALKKSNSFGFAINGQECWGSGKSKMMKPMTKPDKFLSMLRKVTN